MKRLILCILAVLTLATLLTACKKDPADLDPGYIFNQSNAAEAPSEIEAFYKGNANTLAAIAEKLTKGRVYANYNYYAAMTNYETGAMSFLVQQEKSSYGTSIWATCNDETMTRLTAVRFVGHITYDPTLHTSVVLITPRVSIPDGRTVALVYCGTDAGKTALQNSELYLKYETMTLTPLADKWYALEAIPFPAAETDADTAA